MQGSFEEKRILGQDSDLQTDLSQDFCKHMNFIYTSGDFQEEEIEKETTANHDEGEEEEFSFTCGAADMSPIAAEDAFINGQIKAISPLFDRDLFSTHDELDSLHENLPTKPPVKKIFVETKDSGELTSANAGIGARKAVEVSPEVCKKSNSTGFSKIWRFKDFLGRSNSDGRDAFVFLNDNSHAPPMMEASEKGGEERVERKLPKAKKGKTASLSAHEVYLRSKAKDDEKRRSYLPYRPELMGFFTNVNSGLSKNVHPY
ncbi:uncharacterized protein LOC142541303 [Primulina tabacum]|uniref:uncharacterized protein LOC142541303 n=1 Tax=Primulina tabacum TaxID=48773 RepID=UPI003F59F278